MSDEKQDEASPHFDDNDMLLMATIDSWAADIAKWAAEKGFWDQLHGVSGISAEHFQKLEGMLKAQKQMLMVSELGEMLEALRKPGPSEKLPSGFTQEEEELADLIIRALDYAGHFKLRLGEAILLKHRVNQGRPYKHGKAF